MTDAQKAAAMEWLAKAITGANLEFTERAGHARTLQAMLAEPRLPKASGELIDVVINAAGRVSRAEANWILDALYAHLARPHVDFAALDEARMDDTSLRRYPRGNAPGTAEFTEPCVDQAEIRKAISVLRGWSAKAAGRTGLQPAVLLVCNAARSTLPRQMYRVTNGADLDVVREGPISISEEPE